MERIRPEFWRHCTLLALLVAGDCWTSPPRQGFWITAVTSGGPRHPSTIEPVTPPRRGIEIRRQAVGPFVVIEASAPVSRPLLIDLPDPRNWIQLTFDTSNRRVNVTLTDDGGRLSVTAQAPECAVELGYLQYAPRGHERRLYAAMDTSLAVLARLCVSSTESVNQYRRRFERSSTDFPVAIRAMRARVTTVLGPRIERCLPPDPLDFGHEHEC